MHASTFAETLERRSTIRNFSSQDVSEAILAELLTLVLKAPSSGNSQCWAVIKTRDQQQKKRLYECHNHQNVVLSAPLILTFCGDYNRVRHWLDARGASQSYDDLLGLLTCYTDAIIAATTLAYLCESKGLGTCFLGTATWNMEKIADALKLPQYVVPAVGLAVGWPEQPPMQTDKDVYKRQ